MLKNSTQLRRSPSYSKEFEGHSSFRYFYLAKISNVKQNSIQEFVLQKPIVDKIVQNDQQ